MTFRDYLATHIFSKIGLNDTYYDFYNQALRLDPQRVSQYFKYYDNATSELMSVGADVLQLDLGVAAGTGGLISTVDDQVSFWYALFNKTTKGAPLVTAASRDAILAPRTFIANSSIKWENASMPIWVYYTQGVVVICSDEDCPSGPRWIQYTGGTVTVMTANIMDYTNYAMSQVWTSTVVLMTDRETFEAAEKRQTGTIGEVVKNWANAQLDATHLCLLQMFSESPPMGWDVGARKWKETDS
jgi:CubicO group peptidase (beta-lactamase class C family)